MQLFLELMANIIVLVKKPFSFIKVVCLFCMGSVFLVTQTWMQLFSATVNFHVNICQWIIIWTVALICLPVRVLTALQRERLLEMHLHEMQIELENLVWDKKELEERLQIAIKDRRIIESILAEFEEEHDKAIYQIELQEGELQELKDENFRLNEIQEKGLWNFKARDDPGSGQKDNFGIPLLTEYGIPSLKAGYSESGVILQNLMHRDAWEDKNGFKIRSRDFLTNMNVDEALNQCRKVALSQSLFSAFLSLLVGMIIWEAEDPCVPLVVALFTVVGMSLKSVVEFFSTIKNKPASDAVALLSFNWFILGTLTYPTLPRVAHMLAPHARIIVERIFSWLGLSSS